MKQGRMNRLRLTLALAIAVPLWIICATCARPNYYDGGPTEIEPYSDSVRIVIENHRTRDALDPHFILTSAGPHQLGIVNGMDGRLDRNIPRSWLLSDGCMRISAHWVGAGTFYFEQFCMRRGEQIQVSLDNIFNPAAAWSHR